MLLIPTDTETLPQRDNVDLPQIQQLGCFWSFGVLCVCVSSLGQNMFGKVAGPASTGFIFVYIKHLQLWIPRK